MYVKTNWVDNTTPINETNLNKIEKGIYDNSLITEAIADKLNPTDTETYKTAELTEGQITDVIGVNDIIIKGQTSQNGEPTPSAPVDVNVVSGSNVVNTSNKNLFNKDTVINKSYYSGNVGEVISIVTFSNTFRCPIFKKRSDKITISANVTNAKMRVLLLDKDYKILSTTAYTTLPITIDTSNCEFIAIFFDGTTITINNNIQIEQNSTATTYEPHQGKELPLDLPVENLFNKNNTNIVKGFLISTGMRLATGNSNRMLYISCKPNTTYTISRRIITSAFRVATYDSTPFPTVTATDVDYNISNFTQNNSGEKITIITGDNAKYLVVHYGQTSDSNLESSLSTIQIEEGSKANAYTPYGTTPIELCKIGDYQDYFYKSGSKWYLHKEIRKITLDGSETKWYKNNLTFYLSDNFPQTLNALCSHFTKQYNTSWISTDTIYRGKFTMGNMANQLKFMPIDENINTIEIWKTWLSTHNVTLYYALVTPTNTEITGTLKEQLEAIYNAPLYEQTNITQANNDLPMILDITACKDNINGIKAFIRK